MKSLEILTKRIQAIRQPLGVAKVRRHQEIHVFSLLTSNALECALEYTNESLNINGHMAVSPSELRRFSWYIVVDRNFQSVYGSHFFHHGKH
jgi:hypothetical protein